MTPETKLFLEKQKNRKLFLVDEIQYTRDEIINLAKQEGYTGRTTHLSSDMNIFAKIIYFLRSKGHQIKLNKT